MQPDPLSHPQEEAQPKAVSSDQDRTMSEPQPAPQQPRPVQSYPAQPAYRPAPAPAKQRSTGCAITSALLALLVIVLFVAAAGLGYWGYTLNTKLTTTQQELATLRGQHEKLNTDYSTLQADKEQVSSELTQSKADLEKANADLATAQADLKKAQDENKDRTAKLAKSTKMAQIVSILFANGDYSQIPSLVSATNDAQLKSLWAKFTSSSAQSDFNAFLSYLVSNLYDSLK